MKIGVTGSRKVSSKAKKEIQHWVKFLPDDTVVYHGCCVGVDGLVAKLAHAKGLRVRAVVPFSTGQIDWVAYRLSSDSDRIECPLGDRSGPTEHYRFRNEVLVYEVDKLVAFWNGNTRSGTYMTMNICEKAGKQLEVLRV